MKYLLIILSAFFFFLPYTTHAAFSGAILPCGDIVSCIVFSYEWLIRLAVVATVAVIVLAGFRWMVARGDTNAVTGARKMIANALIGLSLALGSYTLLFVLNPALVTFGPLNLKSVEEQQLELEWEETEVVNPDFDQITEEAMRDPGKTIDRINELMLLYKKAADAMDVPWELLAALHYQEAGNNPNKSMFNGFEICNNRDNSSCEYCRQGGATRENDYKCAAKLLHGKAKTKWPRYKRSYSHWNTVFDLNKNSPITADTSSAVANVMFRYNGVCPRVNGQCQDITGSAYIMNMLTPAHVNMPFEGRLDSHCKLSQPGCLIKKTWGRRDGALRFILRLKNPANFDASGKLIKMD